MESLLRFSSRLGLTGLVLILLLSNAGRAQTPDELEWQTFTEPDFGFQIDYPAGWVPSLAADNTHRDRAEGVVLRSIGFFGPGSRIIFVDVWENPNAFSPAEWLARYPAPLTTDPTLQVQQSESIIAGQPAIVFTGTPIEGNRVPWHYRTQFRFQSWMIAIEYAGLTPDWALYQSALSSFGPLDPTQKLPAIALTTDLPPAEFGITQATCCGLSDREYNPFPCNTGGDSSCLYPPCGNCTWWVRYRRQGGAEANLERCTGDANTWGNCAQQYYPHLISTVPDAEAVVLYSGINHISFIEKVISSSGFQVSDLSWSDSCPAYTDAYYYNVSTGGGKSYILHPDRWNANVPPNAPTLNEPADDAWLATRDVTLRWTDGGDPDDGPALERSFFAYIDGDGWDSHSGWRTKTTWPLSLPADGLYAWKVKANDGLLESNWSTIREFRVDTQPPAVALTGPATGRWYNIDKTVSWSITDAGSGVDYFKWAWDDSTPDNRVDNSSGSSKLSAAGQGQHTLYVRGWDELQHASATASWGWLGYDTVPPSIAFAPTNPAANRWVNTPFDLGWTVNDPAPGSGAAGSNWGWDSPQFRDGFGGAAGSVTLATTQGKHTLYVQPRDAAGNTGSVANAGWFGYDSLAPTAPQITIDCAAPNNQWQNTCAAPVFSWSAGEPAGVEGAGGIEYAFGWGTSAAVTLGDWGGTTGYTPTAVAAADGLGEGYLHVQARDGAGNLSSPATFGLRYDGTAQSSLEDPSSQPDAFVVRLNGDALFTNVPTVTVYAAGPGAIDLRLSNDPSGAGADWVSAPLTATWVISISTGAGNMTPGRVYGWFRDVAGTVYGPYFDEIIVDTVAPRGWLRVTGTTAGTVTLSLFAWDDSSGLAGMRLGLPDTVESAAWLPFAAEATFPASGDEAICVQFRDAAGNSSRSYCSVNYVYLPQIFRQ